MREIRTHGSEGRETGNQPVFLTPIPGGVYPENWACWDNNAPLNFDEIDSTVCEYESAGRPGPMAL